MIVRVFMRWETLERVVALLLWWAVWQVLVFCSLSVCSSTLISFFPFSFFPGSFAAEVRKKSRGLLPTTWREAECLPLLLLLWTDFESCPFGLHTRLSAIRRPKRYLLIFKCHSLAFLRLKCCLCIWNWKLFFCVCESGCSSLEVLLSVGDLRLVCSSFISRWKTLILLPLVPCPQSCP